MAADQGVPAGNSESEALATAIGLYALGECTLGQAAERAGISRYRMRDILDELGFDVHLGGPRNVDEIHEEL